jgi:DNA repair protein RadC
VHTKHRKRGKPSSREKVLKCNQICSWLQTKSPELARMVCNGLLLLSKRQAIIDLTCFMGTISQA